MEKISEAGAAPRSPTPAFGELDSELRDAVLFAGRILKFYDGEHKAGRPTPLMSSCALILAYCWDKGIDWRAQMEKARTRFPFHSIGSAEPRPEHLGPAPKDSK